MGSSPSFGDLAPEESQIFSSLTFTTNEMGWVNINPSAHPNTTTVAARSHNEDLHPRRPTKPEGGSRCLAPFCRTTGAPGHSGFTHLEQPASTPQLVTMVCGNCLITHTPEDCIVTGLTTSDNTNQVNVVSLLDGKSNNEEPIHLTNDDENAGLPVI